MLLSAESFVTHEHASSPDRADEAATHQRASMLQAMFSMPPQTLQSGARLACSLVELLTLMAAAAR
jgi:hypothetical protein